MSFVERKPDCWIAVLSCDCDDSSTYYGPFDSESAADAFCNAAPTKYAEFFPCHGPRSIAAGLDKLIATEVPALAATESGETPK